MLLFGLKLVKVECKRRTPLPGVVDQILQDQGSNLPEQIHTIMKQYRSRHLRYITLRRPHLIEDLNDVPTLDPDNLGSLHSDSGLARHCTDQGLPNDGSSLNLIVEEPLTIDKLEGVERFCSREVSLFLHKFGVNIFPRGGKVCQIFSILVNLY